MKSLRKEPKYICYGCIAAETLVSLRRCCKGNSRLYISCRNFPLLA